GGCAAVPVTTSVTIYQVPNAIATPASQTICSATATNIALSSAVSGTTYAWTVVQTGVSGASNGNGNSIIQTLTATGFVSGTAVYTITPTANGCAGTPITVTITVNPTPNAIATPASQTICSATATNIALSSAVSGTTYAWTVVQTGVSGASNGSGNTIVQTLTATGSVSGTAVYTVTPTANGCTGTPMTVTITVTPIPNAIATPSSQTICSGTANNIALSSAVAGTTYTWTVVQTGVTGAANGGGAAISQTLTTTGITPGTAVYTVTPVANGCIGSPIDVTITVNPAPVVTATPASEMICSGQSTGITLSSTITGTTYSWTVVQTGVTGASNGSGNMISQLLTTTGAAIGTVVYTVTPMYNGCAGAPLTIQVTVTPKVTMTATAVSSNICSGETATITFASSLPNTVYNWNVVQTYATGASNGTGTSISQMLTATGNVQGQAVYTITPVVNGCEGIPVTVIVNVNPIPVVTANPSSSTICSGTATNIVLTGNLPNTTFTWSVIHTGVFGAVSGSGSVINQTLTITGSVPQTATYIITPSANGCTGTPITVTVTVNPTPEVFGTPLRTVICSGDNAEFSLTPNIPGTTFTWTVNQQGVSGAFDGSGNGNPQTVSQQLQTTGNAIGTVTYTVTPSANGCDGTPITITFTVHPLPTADIPDGMVCVDAGTGSLIYGYPMNTGLSDATHDFQWYFGTDLTTVIGTGSSYTATQAGQYTVSIVSTTAPGCSNVIIVDVTESNPASALNLYVNEAFSNNPTITAIVTGGSGNYQYQLDGGAYQTSNEFTGILPGLHEVHVIDLDGCTDLTQTIYVIGYPHFFTPNGDGYNETWNIWDLQDQPNAEIMIFDRYGKFIKQISPVGEGWNGTYNGELLPSTDYWFTVKFKDGVNKEERIFKAHFSMKR
ncbi:PKD-like domain-containing protein, partial [Flavobacterium saliperosum]